MSDTLTVSNINYKNISGSTITTSTITGSVLNISTLSFQSTVISLGQSTNQAYYNFSGGSFTAGWASTLSTTASTAGAGLSRVQKVTMSQSGQYQLAVQSSVTSYSVVKSSDSGLTWQTLTNGANGLPNGAVAYPQATATGTPAYTSISYSATGQYALASVRGGLLYVSNNATAATPTFTAAGMGTPYIYLPLEGAVTDVMGNSAVTTPGTVPGYVTGIVGTQAVNLANTPGASGSGIRCIRCPWTGSANFTMSFWFNSQQPVSASYQYIAAAYSSLFSVYITPSSGQLSLVIPTGGGLGYQTAVLGPIISANVWYNVTAIFQTGSTCSMYVNNVLYGTYTNVSGVGTATTANVGLGCYDNSLNYPFNGYIDDFRLYNSAVIFNPIVPANWSHTAVSATGQYMLAAAAGGGLFQSSDFGKTWTQVNALLNGGVWNSLTVSASGQYALATTSAVTIQPNISGITSATTTSWSTNGVTWTATQSSAYLGTFVAYKMLNNTITASDSWASTTTYNTVGNASGFYTVIQGVGSVQGDWAQIQSSVPLVMYSYQLATAYNTSRLPKTYYIIGSNDGLTWYPIQYVSGGTVTTTATYTLVPSIITVNTAGTQSFGSSTISTTTYSTTVNAYTYFRLVALTTYVISPTAEVLDIGEWYINFVGGLTYTSNYGQTWSNAANSLFRDFGALSGDGQYTLGVNNQIQTYAYLPLDGNQNDSRGVLTNATNGTGSGAATYPGDQYKVGTNAVYLANTAGATSSLSYLNYTVPAALVQPNELTMACWVYPTAIPATGWSVPIGFNGIGSTAFGTQIAIQITGIPLAQIYGTTTVGYAYGNAAISTNTWSHLAMTFSTGTGSFYVNGVLQSTVGGIGALNVNAGGSVTNFYVGANTTAWGGFRGYIDDVRIYTSALTANAIAELYAVPALNPIPLLYLGNNYLTGLSGSSYTPITLSNINAIINCASCSNTGQYMTVLTQGTTNNVYYSTNYGSTWTALTVGSSPMTSCAMSADGTYITVSNATNVYTLNWNGQGFSVAMGSAAGAVNQASNAIAIGNNAGQTNQTANSIVLNASGAAVNPYTQGFYVAPIAQAINSTAPTFPLLGYGSDNQIVQSATSFSNQQQTIYGEWIQYQLATASPITSYTLYSAIGYPQFNPVSWVILGSTDGTNWTLLDTQTGTTGWGIYTLTQATASYTYYRMVVTQITNTLFSGVYYVDIGAWVLNNGPPIFGTASNYTLATGSQGYSTVLQLNGTTVCTTTFSFTTTQKLGVALNGTNPNGWIPTSDGYTRNSTYFGFITYSIGAAYEYNSSSIAFQGTSTTINTTVLGNTNMSGMLCLMGNSRVGIGSTQPRYTLDVLGTTQISGMITTASQQDTTIPSNAAYATLGQTWTVPTNPIGIYTAGSWQGATVSATGQYMTVCSGGSTGTVWYSQNYGLTWAQPSGLPATGNWMGVRMSGSGQYQVITQNTSGTLLYVSSNYGATWVSSGYTITGYGEYNCLSYNGQYQYAPTYTSGGALGYIGISTNYGVTWTNSSAPTNPWRDICCSWSGQYVSATIYTGTIYYSTNYGTTWTASNAPSKNWIGICCSASGQYQTALANGEYIYYSSDYGVSWTANISLTAAWFLVACTASGQYQMATVAGGTIYYSTNYGQLWTASGATTQQWNAIAMSQNGLYTLATAGTSGYVSISMLSGIGLISNNTNMSITCPSSLTPFLRLQHTYAAAYLSMGAVLGVNSYIGLQCGNLSTSPLNIPPFLVTNSGYVGIGTTAPSHAIHIEGGTRSRFGIFTGTSTESPFGYISPSIALGLTAGSLVPIVQFGSGDSSSFGRLCLYGRRSTTIPSGSDWTKTHFMLRYEVDSTPFNCVYFDSGGIQISGALSKGSGTFDIEHPLYPGTQKRLCHSFVEGPRCDLIYRGSKTLVGGQAIVDINKECTFRPEDAMDHGTFEALCANPDVFLQNRTGFARVIGSITAGTLTITCENASSSDTISWMVVAERKDSFIKKWNRTDEDGYLITQYNS